MLGTSTGLTLLLGNFNFCTIEWGDRALEDLFARHNYDNWSICPNLMGAFGLGKGFGIDAECICDGATMSGMGIACKYNVCVLGLCGLAEANVAFGNFGFMLASGCFDLDNNVYRQICFSYEMPLANIFATTCSASYLWWQGL
jgi:hypothetical protein